MRGISTAFWTTRRGGCALLGGLTLLFFADVLFGAGDRILSMMGTDIWRQFAGWRSFGFEQIRQGNFPFWTPLVYGGIPYFSGFQSGLLYPPNWLHFFLPLAKGINWGIALHVWLLGAGMFLWMRALGLRQAGALFSGVLIMFAGPHFLHIFAGHLTNLCVMAWMPWLMLAVSRWREEKRLPWVFMGAGIVAMEILAGHPQYVYFGAIVSTLYAGLLLFEKGEGRVRFVAGFATMYMLAALLTAVQLLPGVDAAGESLRGGGDKNFSGTYSFPPENLLTMLSPSLFGDMEKTPYWGRWFFWEASAYLGAIGLWCAVAGGCWGGHLRHRRPVVIAAGACLLLAFGSYTPLFDVMYAVVPGYGLFRGSAKFIFFAILFAVALAGAGIDALLGSGGKKRRLTRERLFAGAGMILLAVCVVAAVRVAASRSAGSRGMWAGFRRWVWETGQVTHLPESVYFGDELVRATAGTSAQALWMACGALAIAVACTLLRHRHPAAGWVLLAAGMIEVILFGARFRESFRFSHLVPAFQTEFRAANPGDYRVADLALTNAGMLSEAPDLWGDDPGVLRRYAEFIAVTQNIHPDAADQHIAIKRVHPRWDLLRFKYVFEPTPEGVRSRGFDNRPMERFSLMGNYEVIGQERPLLARLFQSGFDPEESVLLEEPPAITVPARPGQPVEGRWLIEREDTDEVIVRVWTAQPCILLMTDPYCRGWRAKSLSGDAPQAAYVIQPANHVLRAIALEKGEHHLRIYYLPRTFKPALAVSGWAALMWGFGLAWSIRKGEKGGPTGSLPG